MARGIDYFELVSILITDSHFLSLSLQCKLKIDEHEKDYQCIFDLLRWDAVKDVFGDGKQIKLHFYSDYLPETSSDKFKTVPGLTKYPTDHILFPIPQYEMDQNKAIIENNPGY